MVSALRNTVAGGVSAPTLLEWLQSDGTGYVDTGFVVTDYRTKNIIEAACTTFTVGLAPLVMAGATSAINDRYEPVSGFACVFNDRQLYIRRGLSQFWNASGNQGNWNNGQFRKIEIMIAGQNSATASVDGTNISMSSPIGSQAPGALPSDSQTVFASKTNGSFTLINSAYKVRRVAYVMDGEFLADFRAAVAKDTFGLYDIISGEFHPGTGGFTAGSGIS